MCPRESQMGKALGFEEKIPEKVRLQGGVLNLKAVEGLHLLSSSLFHLYFFMATLSRTRAVHSDVSDAPRDLTLGIPSPFPSNALLRERGELLHSLSDDDVRTGERQAQERRVDVVQNDIHVEPEDAVQAEREIQRPVVSMCLRLRSKRVYSRQAGGPTAFHWPGSEYLSLHLERSPCWF